jgi:hypothetical protein
MRGTDFGAPHAGPDPVAHGAAVRRDGRGAPHPGLGQRLAPPLDPVQLLEGIPRRMRVGVSDLVEIRVAKASLGALDADRELGTAHRGGAPATRAVSLRLRAPRGGLVIEPASSETQWVEDTMGLLTDDFASWRWYVTPQRRGRRRLHIALSVRSVGPGGLAPEIAFPEQAVEIRVRPNRLRRMARGLLWLCAIAVGAALARFGDGLWPYAILLVKRALTLLNP